MFLIGPVGYLASLLPRPFLLASLFSSLLPNFMVTQYCIFGDEVYTRVINIITIVSGIRNPTIPPSKTPTPPISSAE